MSEGKIQNFKELRVWQMAMQLCDKTLDAVEQFPKQYAFNLSHQLIKSVTSIASNIAEGSVRGSRKEFAQFVSIARGSLAEAETQILIAYRRKLISDQKYAELNNLMQSLHKMLMKLLQSLKQT